VPRTLFRRWGRAFVGIHGLCRLEQDGVNRGVLHIAPKNDAVWQRYFQLTSTFFDVSAARH
jgi:hypothetical protein